MNNYTSPRTVSTSSTGNPHPLDTSPPGLTCATRRKPQERGDSLFSLARGYILPENVSIGETASLPKAQRTRHPRPPVPTPQVRPHILARVPKTAQGPEKRALCLRLVCLCGSPSVGWGIGIASTAATATCARPGAAVAVTFVGGF